MNKKGIFFIVVFNTASSVAPQIPLYRRIQRLNPVAVFLVSYWGMKPSMASGCRTGQPSYIRLAACGGPLRQSEAIAGRFIHQSGD